MSINATKPNPIVETNIVGQAMALIRQHRFGEGGRGVQRDLKECARLFKISAEAGEPAAQFNYGLKVLHGEGVEQNEISGCAWLAVAAENPRVKGTQYAERINLQRDRVWAGLSASDRERAERLKGEIQSRIKAD